MKPYACIECGSRIDVKKGPTGYYVKCSNDKCDILGKINYPNKEDCITVYNDYYDSEKAVFGGWVI